MLDIYIRPDRDLRITDGDNGPLGAFPCSGIGCVQLCQFRIEPVSRRTLYFYISPAEIASECFSGPEIEVFIIAHHPFRFARKPQPLRIGDPHPGGISGSASVFDHCSADNRINFKRNRCDHGSFRRYRMRAHKNTSRKKQHGRHDPGKNCSDCFHG